MQDLFERYCAQGKIFAQIILNSLFTENNTNLSGFYTPQELQNLYYSYGVTNATHFANLFCVDTFKLAYTYQEVPADVFEAWIN